MPMRPITHKPMPSLDVQICSFSILRALGMLTTVA